MSNQRSWAIVDVAPGQTLEDRLATNALTMTLDPPAEWRQMFDEVWRTYRDYFYDDDLHGLDWHGLRAQYGGLHDQAVTRCDVNFLIGEVNASHTYVGGGDTEAPAGAAGSACSASTGRSRTAPTASPASCAARLGTSRTGLPSTSPASTSTKGTTCSPSTGTPSTRRATPTRPSRGWRARPSSSP